ncbi:MAG: SnoaL-like domain-containing protein [Chloroflexi bacterium]|nr:SnoaL-like domain-containing protein [Chloroflexota bacterium]
MKNPFRFTILIALLLNLSACGSSQEVTDPISVIESYEAAWNAKDLDAVMEHFTDDAVETNGAGTFTGRDEIRGVYEKFNDIFSMDCQNYKVKGNSVTYDCVMTVYETGGLFGERYETVFEGGKIKSNIMIGTFAPDIPISETAAPIVLATPTPLAETLHVIMEDDMARDGMDAILYLLKHPNVEVEAITVAATGEAHCESGVKHALGLVALNKSTGIPVACGRETPLSGDHAFPSPWRENADNLYGLNLPEGGSASPLTAPELIASTIRESTQKITIVATGPLTNIAEALTAHPDIVENIRRIYIMGGAVEVNGNVGFSGVGIQNQVAEWNIYVDPRAANLVFNSGAPITLVPLDATNDVPATTRYYKTLEAHRSTAEAGFVYDLMDANLGMIQSGGTYFWDELAAAIATDESLATFKMFELQVVEEEGPESGYTKPTAGGAKIRVAVSANAERFEETFLNVLNIP